MAFPVTEWPTSVDASETRADGVDIVYDDDFMYHDDQIVNLQTWLGATGAIIGSGISGEGPGGVVSPIVDGGGGTDKAVTLAARDAYSTGDVLSVGDNWGTDGSGYVVKLALNADGVLWALGGMDATEKLVIPHAALPAAGEEGKLQWDTVADGLKYDNGSAWVDVGATAGSYIDMVSAYSYTQQAVPIDEVGGQGVFDGSLVGGLSVYFQGVVMTSMPGGGTASLKLYDYGPKSGPPEAPRLISTMSTTTNGGPTVLEQELTVVSASPGTNEILDSARMYTIVIFQTSASGDTVYVGSAGIRVR